jgi:uncharacterized protein YbjT (DUF2867 family)
MILVTTTGKVGSEAARQLALRGLPVRVLAHHPAKAAALADAGVDVVEGDLDVPASVDAAMHGVSSVVLVSPAIPAIASSGSFASPTGDGRIGMIDTRDVAAVAAEIAASPGLHAGKTYWPTGPDRLSYADAARVLSKVLGRQITFRPTTCEEQMRAMIDAGLPEAVAEDNAKALSLFAAGDADYVTDDVLTLLGRPARSFEQFVTDYAAAFS